MEKDRGLKNKGKKKIFSEASKERCKGCKQLNTGRKKQILEKGKSKRDKSHKNNASKIPEKKTNCDSVLKISKTVPTAPITQGSNDIGNSNKVDLPTAKSKEEEFKQRRDSWQLTKEEFTSVPTLMKPTMTPMDEQQISQMAEMMMKSIGDKGGQSSQELKSSETLDDYQKQTKAKSQRNLKNKCKMQSHSKKGGTMKAKSKAVEIIKAAVVQTAMTSKDEKTAAETAKENQKEKYLESNAKATAGCTKYNVPEISKHLVKDLHKRGNQKATYESDHKVAKNSSDERYLELANNTEHHSTFDKQVQSKSSANKLLKAKRSGFFVPKKGRLNGGIPTRKSKLTIPDKEASRATANIDKDMLGTFAPEKSIRIGIDKIQSACDVSRRDLVTNIQINCQPVLTEKGTSVSNCASTSSEVDDSYPGSRNNTSSVEKHSKGKSRKDHSTVLKRKSDGVQFKLQEQTPHSKLKCSDGKEELEEIISLQEVSEILADSFITNTKVQEQSTGQTYKRFKTSSNEKSTSPLVPRNVTDKMQLDEVLKNVDMKSEGLCRKEQSYFNN